MALVAFIRGANVGGHRTFRPSLLAKELSAFDVVNIGAAGTFVARKPATIARFRAALTKALPFEADLQLCDGDDILRLEKDPPFGKKPAAEGVTRFVSMFPACTMPALPISLPSEGPWLVRVIGARDQFVFGEYRRDMKTIGYLGQLDRLFGGRPTTRNWNTMMAIARVLKG